MFVFAFRVAYININVNIQATFLSIQALHSKNTHVGISPSATSHGNKAPLVFGRGEKLAPNSFKAVESSCGRHRKSVKHLRTEAELH